MARSRVSGRTRQQIMDDYNYYVDEINRSLDEIERADPDSIALDKYRGYFEKLEDQNLDYNTMRRMRASARNVLESGQVSLASLERSRAQAIDTLRKEGYDFINKRNFNSYMRFLDDARARGLGSLYSSEQIIEKIHEMKQKGLSKTEIRKNIERWERQIKRDPDGKVIEQVKPRKLTIKRY